MGQLHQFTTVKLEDIDYVLSVLLSLLFWRKTTTKLSLHFSCLVSSVCLYHVLLHVCAGEMFSPLLIGHGSLKLQSKLKLNQYNSKHSLSIDFVRNTTEEPLVYLFTVQPNKLMLF